jgi:hypothetical protein
VTNRTLRGRDSRSSKEHGEETAEQKDFGSFFETLA